MNYALKDKLIVTKDFIDELAEKSWQEIEYLQSQLANLADTDESKKVGKLLNNLLTSYYVFVGGLENFDSTEKYTASLEIDKQPELANELAIEAEPDLRYETTEVNDSTTAFVDEQEPAEPFEYFVDFDEPVGDPLTDDDLYNT